MRKCKTIATTLAILIIHMSFSQSTPGQTASDKNLRFRVELNENDQSQGLTLHVTFYGTKPTANKTQQSLRHLLDAASVMYPDLVITAMAWHSESAETKDRTAITLSDGTKSLTYLAKDKNTSPANDHHATSGDEDLQADIVSTLTADSKVVKDCKSFSQEQIAILSTSALEKRGEERKYILKAMREWCKSNDVELSRKMRVCMSSISKAVVALPSSATDNPEDLSEAIARGKESYGGDHGCLNCHRQGGHGGPKGPDLTDSVWLHCDGSIEGIKKIILSGVPLNKMKDPDRPWPMKPSTSLKTDKKQLQDLAIYVHSLSQSD